MKNTNAVLNQNTPLFLTDAGLETWLVFHRNIALREFASFELLHTESGKQALRNYFSEFLELANSQARGFILDTPTWRANPDWSEKLGFDLYEMEEINNDACTFMQEIKAQYGSQYPVLINGVIGPRGDGYVANSLMTAAESSTYHSRQIAALKNGGADLVSALTMTNCSEALGIAQYAKTLEIPCVISFTVETDGRLPSGQDLGDAIAELDAKTGGSVLYYMINCAHPDHFRDAVSKNEPWILRIGGLRSNASRMSHVELDAAESLDEGIPSEFGDLHVELQDLLPNLRVLGGCCGTDLRHVSSIAENICP